MNILIFIAVFMPMLGGVASYLTGLKSKNARDWLAIAVSAATLVCAVFVKGEAHIGGMFGLGLSFHVSDMQHILAVLAAVIWTGSELFGREYLHHVHGRNRYHLFALITLGATEGIFLSGDLFTTFVFFEIMSFTSYVTVKQTQDEKAMRAGQTYLAVAVGCGMATLTGLMLLYSQTGTLAFDEMYAAAAGCNRTVIFVSAVLILIGFGAKAGMFPIHIWLPDTHPAAPAPFSAILSCILTKTGVFGILVVSCKLFHFDIDWGYLVLVLGTITMALGAVMALLSVDLKRTLACSSLSQIGFVLVGVGMQCLLGDHSTIAMDGTIGHIVNHSIIKLGLFTAAGVMVMNKDTLDLNKLQGYGRHKTWLMVCFALSALGVSGIPGFGGYISKTLLHESIVHYGGLQVFEWIFIVSGGFTLAYMTKLFVCIFIEKGEGEEAKGTKYLTPGAAIVLAVAGIAMPIFGLFPVKTLETIGMLSQHFMGGHGHMNGVHYYNSVNLIGGGYSIAIGILVYIFVVRRVLKRGGKYVNIVPEWLSTENKVYRPMFAGILPAIGRFVAKIPDGLTDGVIVLMKRGIFNQEGKRVVVKESNYFGKYSDEPYLRRGFTDTLAFSFLLLGICLVAGLIYMLTGHV